MPAYNSRHNHAEVQVVGNMAILPFETRIRGPAPPHDPSSGSDILDEAIELFRANVLFRNYTLKGPADRTLIYLILFISGCLDKLASANGKTWTVNEASKQLSTFAIDHFALPGDAGFPLNNLYAEPGSRPDADLLRQYLLQARQELVLRFVPKIYGEGGKPNKFWMAFQKRRFMNKTLS